LSPGRRPSPEGYGKADPAQIIIAFNVECLPK
jgi:hypothetical protein